LDEDRVRGPETDRWTHPITGLLIGPHWSDRDGDPRGIIMKPTADAMERIRQARRNLAQVEELRTLVGRLLKETDTLLASLDEPNDTDAGSRGASRFKKRS